MMYFYHFWCPKMKPWSALMAHLGLLLTFVTLGCSGVMCPDKCVCDDQSLKHDCSDGDLEGIPIFFNPETKVLKAPNNRITKLDGALGVYTNLEVLDLSNNSLKHLGKYQFAESKMLHLLNLSNNYVATLHAQTFKGPKALQTLDLSKNILTALVNSSFIALETLVELRLSHNKINSLHSAAFTGLVRLRALYLDHNLMSFINPSWFEPLGSLRFLYLGHNMIRALPPLAFRPLKALKILDLGHNKIHNISNEAFYGARAVDTLDLSDNLLNSVPNEAMIAMENLAYLELSENPIKKIGGNSFNAMYVLRSLKLNRMYQLITMEVDALVENVQLKSIELSNNPLLQPLPWGIFSANLALSDLNFINNSGWTTLFPSQVPVRSIQNLQLSGIPFYCNCSLIWLWELYQQNSSDFHLDQVTCQSVSNSAKGHVPLQEVQVDDLACANWTFVLLVSSIAILITVGILILVMLIVYKCKQRSRTASPCFHIKDDTMIYSRATATMNYHHNPLDTESNTYAKAILQGGYSPPSTEPLYEVPKYTQEELEQPKSSSTGSSKYSSSGYVGSELWESDFLGQTTGNPIVMSFGTQRSPRSSSGLGSTNSSTGSTANGGTPGNITSTKPVFYSPARTLAGHGTSSPYHNHHTLMSASNSPAKYSMFMMANSNGGGSPKYPMPHQQHHLVSGTSIRSPRGSSRPIHNAYV